MDKSKSKVADSADAPVIDTGADQPKVSLGPLGQYFKRRSEFFESEALSFAIQLERLAQSAKE
jgi:hypothetical protein